MILVTEIVLKIVNVYLSDDALASSLLGVQAKVLVEPTVKLLDSPLR